MKQYLLTIAAIVLVTVGCQKQIEINNPQATQMTEVDVTIDGMEITAGETRATVVTDMPNFDANGFTIAGFYTKATTITPPILEGKEVDIIPSYGTFGENMATLTPNIFNYIDATTTPSTESILQLTKKDGKFSFPLSKWPLDDYSHLTYVAWAANVGKSDLNYPIKSTTSHGSLGAPFIEVECVKNDNSFRNTDVLVAKSMDNRNDVLRNSMKLEFKHVLSKMKFIVKNTSDADIKINSAVIHFASGKVARTAKYLFNDSSVTIGTWAEPTVFITANISSTIAQTITANSELSLDEMLLIPQSIDAGAISVELNCEINGVKLTRTVPLKERTLKENVSYTYLLSINEKQITINEGNIGQWTSTNNGLPNIAGARSETVLLLLDAYDAPYIHTDGKKYWLDRSGWNRHCEIIGSVDYNNTERFYSFNDNSSLNNSSEYLSVPPFPVTTSATMEVVTRRTDFGATNNITQSLLHFIENEDGPRIMFTHMGYNRGTTYYFDAGGSEAISGNRNFLRITSTMPRHIYESFAMYSFSKSSARQAMFRNLIYNYDTAETTHSKHSNVNLSNATIRQIGTGFNGDIKYFKVSSVANTNINVDEYAKLAKRHKIPSTEYVNGYVTNGLLMDLQGVDSPLNGYWMDATGNGANAKMVGVTYNSKQKEYQTQEDTKNYLEITLTDALKADNAFNNHTLEIVYYIPKKNGALPNYRHNHFFASGSNPDAAVSGSDIRVIFFHIGYDSKYSINYQSPLLGGSKGTTLSEDKSADYISIKRSYSARRNHTGKTLELFTNGTLAKKRDNIDPYNVGKITKIIIGEDAMNINAIRLYNRTLTDGEITQNHEIDKKIYGIP